MERSDTLQITEQPWYAPEAATPTLLDEGAEPAFEEVEPALAFNLVPAQAPEPTVALLAAFRMTGRYADVYGDRIPGAVYIVAIDTARGHMYYNHAEPSHAVPLEAVMGSAPGNESTTLASIEGYFNVDLAQQLGLPPKKATYDVFLWLDDVATQVKTVTVPANSDRPDRSPNPEPDSQNYALVFDDQASVTPPRPDGITLERSSEEATVVLGSVGSGLLDSRKAEQKESPVYLRVLGLCQQTRRVATRTKAVPEDRRAGQQVPFRMNVRRFIECEAEDGPVYLLAYIQGTHSSVVTVDLP
jgi:hypothetical protein